MVLCMLQEYSWTDLIQPQLHLLSIYSYTVIPYHRLGETARFAVWKATNPFFIFVFLLIIFIYLYNVNHTEQSKLDYLFKILPCFIRPCFYHPYLPQVLYAELFCQFAGIFGCGVMFLVWVESVCLVEETECFVKEPFAVFGVFFLAFVVWFVHSRWISRHCPYPCRSQRCQRTGRTTRRTEPDPLPHRGQEHRPPQRTLHRRRKEILPRKSLRPGGSGENRIIIC